MSEATISLFILPVGIWMCIALIYFFVMMINCLVLNNECKKRKNTDIVFINKVLKVLPLLSMVSGVLFGLFGFVSPFYGFCHFSYPIGFSVAFHQLVFMGLFQISRLYYCFAQSQVHSNKGYPNWAFNIMYIIGILIMIDTTVGIWIVNHIPFVCGINKEYTFYAKFSNSGYFVGPLFTPWYTISSLIYLLWDMITLILYTNKVISFRKYKSQQIEVFNRIMAILNRILILTLFYEIASAMTIIAMSIHGLIPTNAYYVLQTVGSGLASTAASCSMFLMQQHNTSEYTQFLAILYKYGLYNVCCCFKSRIKNDLEVYFGDNEKENMKKENPMCDDTIEDITVKQQHSVMKEISVQTEL
eukprot:437740_1